MPAIPDTITYFRFALIPVMWAAAFIGNEMLLGVLLLFAGLTDFLDGFLARMLKLESARGSKLDSQADHLIIVSLAIWMFWLLPEAYLEHKILVIVTAALVLAALGLGYLLHKKTVALHLYSSKLQAIITYAFFVHAFIFGYSAALLYIAASVNIISSAEEIFILLARKKVKENTRSVFDILILC